MMDWATLYWMQERFLDFLTWLGWAAGGLLVVILLAATMFRANGE